MLKTGGGEGKRQGKREGKRQGKREESTRLRRQEGL
jgi:hypothetical protein